MSRGLAMMFCKVLFIIGYWPNTGCRYWDRQILQQYILDCIFNCTLALLLARCRGDYGTSFFLWCDCWRRSDEWTTQSSKLTSTVVQWMNTHVLTMCIEISTSTSGRKPVWKDRPKNPRQFWKPCVSVCLDAPYDCNRLIDYRRQWHLDRFTTLVECVIV